MPATAKKNWPFYCPLSFTRMSIALERQSYLLLERLLPRRQKVIPYLACMSRVIRRWWETVFKFSGFSTRFPIINTLFAQALSKPGWCQTYQLWIATVCFRNCPRQSPNTRFKAIWTETLSTNWRSLENFDPFRKIFFAPWPWWNSQKGLIQFVLAFLERYSKWSLSDGKCKCYYKWD